MPVFAQTAAEPAVIEVERSRHPGQGHAFAPTFILVQNSTATLRPYTNGRGHLLPFCFRQLGDAMGAAAHEAAALDREAAVDLPRRRGDTHDKLDRVREKKQQVRRMLEAIRQGKLGLTRQ
jgi:hypothetical protein